MPLRVQDQYADGGGGGDDASLQYPQPPAVAPPNSDPNLVSFLVPSEDTSVQFGSGDPPGIRMQTDRHVHLTAETPLTTISLGSPAGDGISDPAAGWQVSSQGEKLEVIAQRVRVMHGATQDEIVAQARTHTIQTQNDTLIVAGGDRLVAVQSGNHGTTVKLCTSLETQTYAGHASQNAIVTVDGTLIVQQGATAVKFDSGNVEASIDGHFQIQHKGTTILIDEAGKVTITADPELDINCGGAQVSITGGNVTINAPSSITLAVGQSGVKIDATGVSLTGPSVKSTALTGTNEITGMMVKLN